MVILPVLLQNAYKHLSSGGSRLFLVVWKVSWLCSDGSLLGGFERNRSAYLSRSFLRRKDISSEGLKAVSQ